MPSNLRARPIEGYITDNSGNILRRASISIKSVLPDGSSTLVDSAQSDDDGYFVTKPLKSGEYDLYESGVRVYRQQHNVDYIQSYPASVEDSPASVLDFSYYTSDLTKDINLFRMYIQIECPSDVAKNSTYSMFGNLYPLWDIDPTAGLGGHDFQNLPTIHPGVSNNSLLTHTRFDVEYFNPLTQQNDINRRIRWVGVPGIQVYPSSNIVLPLDYYSMIPNHRFSYVSVPNIAWSTSPVSPTKVMTVSLTTLTYSSFLNSFVVGDIIQYGFSDSAQKLWCIVVAKGADPSNSLNTLITSRFWYSSRVNQGISYLPGVTGTMISSINIYQGMFGGVQSIQQSTGERFSVRENTYAQDLYPIYDGSGNVSAQEMYNYNKVS